MAYSSEGNSTLKSSTAAETVTVLYMIGFTFLMMSTTHLLVSPIFCS